METKSNEWRSNAGAAAHTPYLAPHTHTHIYIYIDMAVSRLLWFTKAVGSREVPEQKVKNKIGHETAKNGSFSGIFSKNPKLLIRILIFRYRNMPPNAKNIQKIDRKILYIFLISNPPYIFSYYLNK